MTVTIYHNPRCTKSRETLALLKEHGIEPRVIEYLKAMPGVLELKGIVKKLGLTPRDIVRDNEPCYAELGLSSLHTPVDKTWVSSGDRAILKRKAARKSGSKAKAAVGLVLTWRSLKLSRPARRR